MNSVYRLNQFIQVAEVAHCSSANNYLVLDRQGRVISPHNGPSRDEKTSNQHVVWQLFNRCYDQILSVAQTCSHWIWGVNAAHRVKNRQVWQVFLRTLRHVYGQAKVDRICGRYKIDFSELFARGEPLLSKYVKMISIGSTRILSSDLGNLDSLTSKEIKRRIAEHSHIAPMGKSLNPLNIYGAPLYKRAWIKYDPVLMDKELYYLGSDVKELRFNKWIERFSKCTVNKELMEGQIIPAPGTNGSINYYQVYRRIACDGLIAYGLKPVGSDSILQPFVAFRPTQFALSGEDALETLMNDFQIHIGDWGYSSTKDQLSALMNDRNFCPQGKRVITAGYSLGGAFAQRFMVDHWKKISKAYFFNSPSVEERLAEKFAKRVNASPFGGEPIKMNIFRSTAGEEGDIAHVVGGKHLGWGITHHRFEIKLTEFNYLKQFLATLSDRMWLHSRRVLDNDHDHFKPKRIPQRKLDRHLDNESRGPMIFWYEKTRRIWGGTIFWVLYAIRGFLKPLGILRSATSLDGDKRS